MNKLELFIDIELEWRDFVASMKNKHSWDEHNVYDELKHLCDCASVDFDKILGMTSIMGIASLMPVLKYHRLTTIAARNVFYNISYAFAEYMNEEIEKALN